MKYSIIIATYNRLEEVKELLASAEHLEFDRSLFEIVFVDDGSTDKSKEFIENYQSESGIQTQYFYQKNQGPGQARNLGMEKSRGDYFIFVDSDCLFPSQWLRETDNFILNNQPDAFGGPDTCHESFSPLLKAINYSMTSLIGTGGTRGSKKSVQKKFYPRSFNMGLSRKVWETVGGMGTLRHGQDMEFSARIYRHGFKVSLIPDAFVYHKRRTSLKRFYKQIFNWGVARVNLGRIDKQMFKPIHFIPALLIAGLILFLVASVLPFFPKWLWFVALGGLLMLAGVAFLQSLARYKSLKISFLSIVTLYIQIFAYGLGMWKGLFQVMRGKKTAQGFSKNYYK